MLSLCKLQSRGQRGSPVARHCPQVSQQTPCKATGTGSTSSSTGTARAERRRWGLVSWGCLAGPGSSVTSHLPPQPQKLLPQSL